MNTRTLLLLLGHRGGGEGDDAQQEGRQGGDGEPAERAALLVESGCLDQDSAENDGFIRGSFVDGVPSRGRIRPDPRLHGHNISHEAAPRSRLLLLL